MSYNLEAVQQDDTQLREANSASYTSTTKTPGEHRGAPLRKINQLNCRRH